MKTAYFLLKTSIREDYEMADAAREIDGIFIHYGYDKTVPPVARYVMASSVITLPITLLIVMICCCGDDVDEEALKKAAAKAPQGKA